jgi:hypothetical protein
MGARNAQHAIRNCLLICLRVLTTQAFLTVAQEPISMERRAEPHDVPQNAIERIVRQMLEHGRLADLLFDESDSRGSSASS